MTLDEEIDIIQKELDNLSEEYSKEVASYLKNNVKATDEEKNKSITKIAEKYTDSIIEREDKLTSLLLKKSRGI